MQKLRVRQYKVKADAPTSKIPNIEVFASQEIKQSEGNVSYRNQKQTRHCASRSMFKLAFAIFTSRASDAHVAKLSPTIG